MHRAILAGLFVCCFASGCSSATSTVAGGKDSSEWIEMASDNDPKARAKAIEKLGNIGSMDASGIEAIVEALDDSSSTVRSVAIKAIVRIGAPCRAAFPKLEEMSQEDPAPEIRALAAEAHRNLTN